YILNNIRKDGTVEQLPGLWRFDSSDPFRCLLQTACQQGNTMRHYEIWHRVAPPADNNNNNSNDNTRLPHPVHYTRSRLLKAIAVVDKALKDLVCGLTPPYNDVGVIPIIMKYCFSPYPYPIPE